MASRSLVQRARRAVDFSRSWAISRSTCSRRSFEFVSVSRLRAARSISSEVASRSSASISAGYGADLNRERSCGFVDEVDGLVGEEAVGDVAVREGGGGDDGRVADADLVMRFVALFQAAQDRDGVLNVGLADVDDLEAALESGVLLDVLLVLIQRGCADGTELAAGEGRLEHVGGVDGAFGCAGADQRVQLIDEQDDSPVRLLDFFQDRFEAVFKLAAILCAGQHGAQVEGDNALVAQDVGHIAVDDAAREAFDDGCFANARLADEHGIVLGPTREDLNDTANFFVAPDDGVELAAAGQFREVLRVFLQGLVFCFGVLVGHTLTAAHGGEAFEDRIVRRSHGGEQELRAVILEARKGEQQMLGGDVVVLELLGLFEGRLENLVEGVARAGLRRGAADFGQLADGFLRLDVELANRHTDFVEDGRNHALFVTEKHRQQMQRQNFGIAVFCGELAGVLHRLLRLHRKFVPTNCHEKPLRDQGLG